MQVGGAEANEVVRAEDPSSAGQGVGPLSVAPTGTAGGTMPDFCKVVDVEAGVVVEDDFDLVELFAPMNAPTVESTTITATASAAICRRRRVF